MKLQDIETKKIKVANYNPANRIGDKNLIQSIKEYGIVEPLLLTTNLELVDGHRRLSVAKSLKMKTVPCVLRNGSTQSIKDILYLHVNQNKRKISGADQVEIYKKGGRIEGRFLKPLLSLIDIAGNGIVDVLLENRQSPNNIYTTFSKLRCYMKIKTDDYEKTIIWICKNKSTYAVRRAIEMDLKKSIIQEAINNNAQLKITYK